MLCFSDFLAIRDCDTHKHGRAYLIKSCGQSPPMNLAVTMEQGTHVFSDMSSQKVNDFQLFNFSIEDAI